MLERLALEPTREECLALLAGASLGRLVYTHRALPDVLPVNYRLDGDQVLISLITGSAGVPATRNAVVAFEVDNLDSRSESGWSVTIVGRAREITVLGDRHVHFAIAAERITGRRLRTDVGSPVRVQSPAEGPYPAGGAAA